MGALSYLKEITSKTPNTTKTVLIPLNQTKLGCPNHRDGKGRKYKETIVFSNPKDLEYSCTCGIIYIRSKDYVPNTQSKIIT